MYLRTPATKCRDKEENDALRIFRVPTGRVFRLSKDFLVGMPWLACPKLWRHLMDHVLIKYKAWRSE